MSHSLTEFWGKAQPMDGAAIGMHPLLAHVLDVAAVSVLLPRRMTFGLNAQTLGFLVTLHDIGKISRPFQAQASSHWPARALGPFPEADPPPPGPKHDALGLHILRRVVADGLREVLPLGGAARRGWTDGHRIHLFRALAGHHGRPPVTLDPPPSSRVLCEGCTSAALAFVQVMQEVFRPQPLPRPKDDREVAALGWHLAGRATLADWIGSRQTWFPYVPPDAVADPAAYLWDHALPRAAAAIAAAGLSVAAPAPFDGLRHLFPGISLPSPVQAWAESVPLPEGPLLAVVEDLTGSGKTEAAVTLAHRLMAAGRADGVYLALPTMATANAMFGRLADCYRSLFRPEAKPSLALAHARAGLDPRFAVAIGPGIVGNERPTTEPADQPAEVQCAAWLGQDRRRALLAQVGVGTLDQALMAALPVQHAALRLQGLSGKVLVVDEAHAFDPYMRRELVALLRFHAALGGSAVLLSATLPRVVRQMLVDAFRDGLGATRTELTRDEYPLTTLAAAKDVAETPCAVRDGLSRRVAVTRLEDTGAALERITAAAQGGAAVAWIRNTVDEAIAAAAELQARGLKPLLFHARFAMADRLAIEAEVLRRFGRGSQGDVRRCLLVATQVIEQSLDLDFDLLCTDLAPADLLIQRAGRLWRHQRGERPVPSPELLVVSPEPVEKPDADWIQRPQPGTAAVYRDPALLWRTARGIFRQSAISAPEDMRPLVEEAADRHSPGAVPAALAAAADRALGKEIGGVAVAAQNVLEVWDGYDCNVGPWEPETLTPTRLEDRPQVTLRLARVRNGVVVPYADDPMPARAWALSEVAVARRRVAACPVPAGLEAAAEDARRRWGRWERESDRVLLAVLRIHENGFAIDAADEAAAPISLYYDPVRGLQLTAPAAAG